jgi:outer membrane receptor protein involved in Fe transport
MLRASFGSAFKAPSSSELIPNPVDPTWTPTVRDPRNGNIQVMVPVVFEGGNPDLQPETGETRLAGIIWQPQGALQGLRLNVDYQENERAGAIDPFPTPQFIVDNEDAFPERVVRDGDGNILSVNTRSLNLTSSSSSNATFDALYTFNTANGHRFGLNARHTHIIHLQRQTVASMPMLEAAGHPHDGGAAKDRSNLTLDWERNGFSASWMTQRYGEYFVRGAAGSPRSMTLSNPNPGQPTTADLNNYILPQGSDTVPAQLYHNLSLGYDTGAAQVTGLLRDIKFRFSVNNLFDRPPPMDASYTGNFYINAQTGLRMRYFTLSMTKEF